MFWIGNYFKMWFKWGNICIGNGDVCGVTYSRPREKNQEERCLNFELCSSQSKEVIGDGEKKANLSQCLRDF